MLLLLGLSVGGNAPAVEPSSAQFLSLENALVLAASAHPSVQARRSELSGSQSALEGALWQRFPNLTAQSLAGDNGKLQTTLSVKAPLWSAGRVTAEVEGAQARVDAASAAVSAAQLSIMERVVAAFSELSRLAERLQAAAASVREHERLHALIARRVGNDVSPTADLVLAQARLAQMRAEYAQLETQMANARTSLQQSIGRPAGSVAAMAPRPLFFASAGDAALAARAFSPELRRLQAEEVAAARSMDAQKATLYPQIVARYDHAIGAQTNAVNRAYIGLEYQSGAGLSAWSAVREALGRLEALQHSREATAQALDEVVLNDWTTAQRLSLQAATLQAWVESAREVAASYDRQYAVGRKSWLEVLNAQREATQALYSLADARWGAQQAIHHLDLLTGLLYGPLPNSAP